jgi:hypothetical protein
MCFVRKEMDRKAFAVVARYNLLKGLQECNTLQ